MHQRSSNIFESTNFNVVDSVNVNRMENVSKVVSKTLGIPQEYFRPASQHTCFVAGVPALWLKGLEHEQQIPPSFKPHSQLSPPEVETFLWEGTSLGTDWSTVYIKVVDKSFSSNISNPLEDVSTTSLPSQNASHQELSFSQFLHYVSQTNHKNLWRDNLKKFPNYCHLEENRPKPSSSSSPCSSTTATSALRSSNLRSILWKLYRKHPINPLNSYLNYTQVPATATNGSILPCWAIVESPEHFLLVLPYIPHSVQDAVLFSPALLSSSTTKPLFILYQLLHGACAFYNYGLSFENTNLRDVLLDDTLHMQIMPPLISSTDQNHVVRNQGLLQHTEAWVKGHVTNLDYLLLLNQYANRQNQDPFHHPVMPWVSDFTSANGNWRDFTKSKFRLTKGDRQLDLTFDPSPSVNASRTSLNCAQTTLEGSVSHHVTEVLSEITYFVYRARRTPKEILRRYVRRNWNPKEYPSAMERLYQWTPDECIPDFYTDPTIFKSVHEDLEDLAIPTWASSPEDFIRRHRQMLESPYVTERLHHWIDLTFGYKLSGSAAIKSKNVVLSLVDNHTHLCGRGLVQLFTQPHPKRVTPSPYLSRTPPRISRLRKEAERASNNQCSPQGPSEISEESSEAKPLGLSRFLSRSKNSLLSISTLEEKTEPVNPSKTPSLFLPRDYNPILLLNYAESLASLNSSIGPVVSNEALTDTNSVLKSCSPKERDMLWLGTLVAELFIPNAFRTSGTRLEDRVQQCLHLLQHSLNEIPRCIRPLLQTIFVLPVAPPITWQGLPWPSPHQLLQPLVKLVPFPSTFTPLSALKSRMRRLAVKGREFEFGAQTEKLDLDETLRSLATQTASIVMNLNELTEENVVTLLVSDVQQLVRHSNKRLAVGTAFYLFDTLAGSLGTAQSARFFLTDLVKLMSGEGTTQYHLKLYHRQFLVVLQARLGLSVFLNHVTPLLVEAAGTCHDFLELPTGDPKEKQVQADPPVDMNLSDMLAGTEQVFTLKLEEEDAQSSEQYVVVGSASEHSEENKRSPKIKPASNISDVAADSIIWLAQRLGPVLTARYLSRNLLRMLALCYVEDKCVEPEVNSEKMSMFATNLYGDSMARHVLHCLTSLARLYGEQFVLVQYLPHMQELIKSCQTKLSLGLEAGLLGLTGLLWSVLACLQDLTLLQRSQDALLEGILEPLLSLLISTKRLFPRGNVSRAALALRVLDVLSALGLRLGPDQACKHLVPIAQKLLVAFHAIHQNYVEESEEEDEYSRKNLVEGSDKESEDEYVRAFTGRRLLGKSTEIPEMGAPEETMRLCQKAREELKQTFSPYVAFQTCSRLDAVLGTDVLEDLLRTCGSTARMLACNWAETTTHGNAISPSQRTLAATTMDSSYERVVTGSFGSNVAIVGNRIQVQDWGPPDNVWTLHSHHSFMGQWEEKIAYQPENSIRHLKGNWLAYWEHEIGRPSQDTHLDFKQIVLQTLGGHTGSIKALVALPSETGLLSASKDKTVKIWALKSQGDGNAVTSAQWTYPHHKKPLTSLTFLEGPRLAASCDGALHVWDPFLGSLLQQFEPGNSRLPTLTTVKAFPEPSANLLVATLDGTIRILDTRTASFGQDLKVSVTPGGLIRCLAVGGSGFRCAVGFASGVISILDLRTGYLLGSWKGHEGEVLQLLATNTNSLISSSLDQSLTVWGSEEGKLKFHLRGPSEPVHGLANYHNELVSVTTGNRLGVHSGTSPNASFSSTKLRSETFKGVVTSMTLLPLHRQILLGSDTGQIALMC